MNRTEQAEENGEKSESETARKTTSGNWNKREKETKQTERTIHRTKAEWIYGTIVMCTLSQTI